MPIDVTLADSYLFVRMHGVVTAADLEGYAQNAEVLEASRLESLNRMTDLSEVERFDANYRDMFDLAERRKRHARTGEFKVAAVAREPVQIGMARMFQTLSEHPQIEIRIFNTKQAALDWLGETHDSAVASTTTSHS